MYQYKNNHEIKFCNPSLQSKEEVLKDYYYNAVVNSISRDTKNKTDGPDGYYLAEKNGIAIIEHFEFDASKKNTKGSEYKKQVGEMLNKGLGYARLTHHESKNNYYHNAMDILKAHYEKIPLYFNNLIKEGIFIIGMKTNVIFIIEDVIPLPCFVKTLSGFEPINLFKIKEFLDEFNKMPLLNTIFLSINTANNNPMVYKITHELITEYEKVQYSIDSVEIAPQLDSTIHVQPIMADRFGNPKSCIIVKTDIAKKILYDYELQENDNNKN